MLESLLLAACSSIRLPLPAAARTRQITTGDILDLADYDSVCAIAILGEVKQPHQFRH